MFSGAASRFGGLLWRRATPLAAAAGVAACTYAHRDQVLALAEGALDNWKIGGTLGEGAFAVVKLCTRAATGETYAVKLVDRERSNESDLQREISVLKSVGSHRHIVSLVDSFALPGVWALVLDLVEGGEVFDRICDHGVYSERDAAEVVRQISEAVQHCHRRGIVHRDLKPENLLLVSKKPDADVKLCDFGLARFVGEGHPPLVSASGTVAYMAPEMFETGPAHAEPVDVWALGVITYILLAGYLPFDPEGQLDDAGLEKAIRRGKGGWSFRGPSWKHVSADAKRLIGSMLEPEPSKRPHVHALLADPWVSGGAAPSAPLPSSTTSQLRSFNEGRRTWRAAIRACALIGRAPNAAGAARTKSAGGVLQPQDLSAEALEELRAAFKTYDADGDGTIDIGEMRVLFRSLGADEAQADAALRGADLQGDGVISFAEFCAAVGPLYEHSETALRRAFGVFDADGSGYIERPELRSMCLKLRLAAEPAVDAQVERMFAAADQDGDGRISLDEFVRLFSADEARHS